MMSKGKKIMLNVEEIRKDFPILEQEVNGRKLIYFDNAATTQKPKQVIEAIKNFYEKHHANIHRGLHYLSEKSTQLYEEAHEVLAKHINADSWEEIILAFNTTTAVNMIAFPLVQKGLLEGRDKIIVTEMEHHSNMLPWRKTASILGARIVYAKVKSDGYLDTGSLYELLDEKTSVLAITHASNVTGIVNPVKEIIREAKKLGITTVLDTAQSMPHMKIDVKELGTDFLVFSGHKMLGPTGTGGLYGKKDILEELDPWLIGGGTIDDVTLKSITYGKLPYKYEAGTPNIAGAIGLMEAVKYLDRIGMENIHSHEKELVRYARKQLADNEKIIFYPRKLEGEHTGILTFNIKGVNPHIIGRMLNDFYAIAVRTGLHCAHPYHRILGADEGTVRASFYLYNTREEVDSLIQALNESIEKYFSNN